MEAIKGWLLVVLLVISMAVIGVLLVPVVVFVWCRDFVKRVASA